MKLSRADLRDKFEAYESEATYTTGNKSTHQMIAMADVDQALDEVMNKGDIIHIVSEREFAVNDYVWYNERLNKITKVRDDDEFWKGVEVQIFDIEARTTNDVSRNDLTHVR